MVTKKNRYTQIIEKIFFVHYKQGATEVPFDRADIVEVAKELNIDLPKNLGDVIYSFRYRNELPESIQSKSPKGSSWIIRPAGKARYQMVSLLCSNSKFPAPSLRLPKKSITDLFTPKTFRTKSLKNINVE